jgi:hypothetical protein
VLKIWLKEPGFITYACAHCLAKGYAHERNPDGRKPIPKNLPKRRHSIVVPNPAEQDRDRINYALDLFHAGGQLKGSPGEPYLNSRGIRLDEALDHVLRWHPALVYEGRRVGGIVALFRDIVTDAPCAVHRIFIDADGRKLDRRMLGPVAHAAVKLDASEDVCSGLHLGEGVETCLAARQLGFKPTWALGSAGAIGAFPVLAGIEAISVLAENDRASHDAARAVAARYEPAGAEVYVFEAEAGDINDALRRVVA